MDALKVKLDPGAYMPERAHEGDAGYDLRARDYYGIILARESRVFDTGVHIAIPKGYYGKIEGRSGLDVHYGIVSCGGVIDSGYTGSITVKLYNHSYSTYPVHRGDKIAQLIILPCETPDLVEVDKLEETHRGANGFGSTGR